MTRRTLSLTTALALALGVPSLASAALTPATGAISVGTDTLSGGALAATVPTLRLALDGRVGAVGVGMDVGGGQGDHTTVSTADLRASLPGAEIYRARILPEARIGMLSASGQGAALSTGYILAGLHVLAPVQDGVMLSAHLDAGTTFAGYTTQPAPSLAPPPNPQAGGAAYVVSVGLAYTLTPRTALAVRYSETRLPVSDVVLVDHQATAALAYRF